jgi:hypothetical protein
MMCTKISTRNILNIIVFNTVMSMMHNSICTFQKSINNASITTNRSLIMYERIEYVFTNGVGEYNKIIMM